VEVPGDEKHGAEGGAQGRAVAGAAELQASVPSIATASLSSTGMRLCSQARGALESIVRSVTVRRGPPPCGEIDVVCNSNVREGPKHVIACQWKGV